MSHRQRARKTAQRSAHQKGQKGNSPYTVAGANARLQSSCRGWFGVIVPFVAR